MTTHLLGFLLRLEDPRLLLLQLLVLALTLILAVVILQLSGLREGKRVSLPMKECNIPYPQLLNYILFFRLQNIHHHKHEKSKIYIGLHFFEPLVGLFVKVQLAG